MPRTLSEAAIEHARDPHLDVPVLELLIISHESLSAPVRVVNDSQDLTYDGFLYNGWPFELELPDEGDRAPRGVLTIKNVDRRIGEAVRALHTPPRVRIIVIASDNHDDIWLDYNYLWLSEVTGDVRSVSGQIGPQEQSSRPWPKGRATQREFPALFR